MFSLNLTKPLETPLSTLEDHCGCKYQISVTSTRLSIPASHIIRFLLLRPIYSLTRECHVSYVHSSEYQSCLPVLQLLRQCSQDSGMLGEWRLMAL